MELERRIVTIPLSNLPGSTRQLLSTLLNPIKVIPIDGPLKIYRDWRGLVALLRFSSEVVASIHSHPDKTGKVIDLWCQIHPATMLDLTNCLKCLNRYDVILDLWNDLAIHVNNGNIATGALAIATDGSELTLQDSPGYQHHYHVFILYADNDIQFVNQLKDFLIKEGLEVCTKENLRPGVSGQYAQVAKLLKERCDRIILVYSKDFIESRADAFFRDFSQAMDIESGETKILPIMYRQCDLPHHLSIYHMLRFENKLYSFWDKLGQSLAIPRYRHPNALQNGHVTSSSAATSAARITEISNPHFLGSSNWRLNTPTPGVSERTTSVPNVAPPEVVTPNSEEAGHVGMVPGPSQMAPASSEVTTEASTAPMISNSSPEGSYSSETRQIKKPGILKTMYRKFKRKSKSVPAY